MIIAWFASNEVQQLIANPRLIAQYINLSLIGKIFFLILAALYVIFSIRVLVQIRRLELWLPPLKHHGYGWWALAHLVVAVLGVMLAIFLL